MWRWCCTYLGIYKLEIAIALTLFKYQSLGCYIASINIQVLYITCMAIYIGIWIWKSSLLHNSYDIQSKKIEMLWCFVLLGSVIIRQIIMFEHVYINIHLKCMSHYEKIAYRTFELWKSDVLVITMKRIF